MKRKILILLLMIAMLFPSSFVQQEAQAETPYDLCVRLYQGKFDVPPGYPYCSTNGYPFQQKLWDDLGVIVYGNPELLSMNYGSNNFKKGYADPDRQEDWPDGGGPDAPLHPYFTKNGVKGEYRYLGYDRNGQPYVNPYFIPDMRTRKASDRTWVYRPWSNTLMNGVSNKPNGISPMFFDRFNNNIDFIYSEPAVNEVNSIIKSNAVQVKYSTYASDPNKNLFDYMYVTQDPTVWAPGAGTMWSRDHTGKIWFSSHVIEQRSMKYSTPVEAGIDPGPGVEPNIVMEKEINETFEIPYKVSGKLLDDAYYNDRYDKAKYYTREDVESWSLTVKVKHEGKPEITLGTFTGNDIIIDHGRSYAYKNVNIPIQKSDYPYGGIMVISATAQVTFADGQKRSATTNFSQRFSTHSLEIPSIPPGSGGDPGDGGEDPPPGDGEEEPPVLPPIICEPIVGTDAIDILPFTQVSDNTDMSRVESIHVYINGKLVDYHTFMSGSYVFGDDADGLNYVLIVYTPIDPTGTLPTCESGSWVKVHDSVPGAEFDLNGGTWKENRTMTVTNQSATSAKNDPYILTRYPIVSYSWSFTPLDGSTGQRIMGADTNSYKEFMYTAAGRYRISLTVTNALGRTSDPYTVDFSVIEDTTPAIIQHAYASQVARGDTVDFYNQVVSIDGDHIVNERHQIYYDRNGDETYTQLVDTINGPLLTYTPRSGLGKYKVVTTAEETYGQPTLYTTIPAAAKRTSTSVTYFILNFESPS